KDSLYTTILKTLLKTIDNPDQMAKAIPMLTVVMEIANNPTPTIQEPIANTVYFELLTLADFFTNTTPITEKIFAIVKYIIPITHELLLVLLVYLAESHLSK